MDGIMECVTGMARTLNCLKWTQKTTDTTTTSVVQEEPVVAEEKTEDLIKE